VIPARLPLANPRVLIPPAVVFASGHGIWAVSELANQ